MKEKERCPRCGIEMNGFPALSRRDNETNICSSCGTREAMEDFQKKPYMGGRYWKGEKTNERIN
jgi:transcription elongation factor Elf1